MNSLALLIHPFSDFYSEQLLPGKMAVAEKRLWWKPKQWASFSLVGNIFSRLENSWQILWKYFSHLENSWQILFGQLVSRLHCFALWKLPFLSVGTDNCPYRTCFSLLEWKCLWHFFKISSLSFFLSCGITTNSWYSNWYSETSQCVPLRSQIVLWLWKNK